MIEIDEHGRTPNTVPYLRHALTKILMLDPEKGEEGDIYRAQQIAMVGLRAATVDTVPDYFEGGVRVDLDTPEPT